MADVRLKVGILEPAPDKGRALLRLLRDVMPSAAVIQIGLPDLREVLAELSLIVVGPDIPAEAFAEGLGHGAFGAEGTPVIKILARADAGDLDDWARGGATGFVVADVKRSEFRLAIETVLAGGGYMSLPLLQGIYGGKRDKTRNLALLTLTPREQEILCYIALNMSNKDIARRLGLSVRTIETHRLHIRRKTGASSRIALVQLAERFGLLTHYPVPDESASPPVSRGLHEED